MIVCVPIRLNVVVYVPVLFHQIRLDTLSACMTNTTTCLRANKQFSAAKKETSGFYSIYSFLDNNENITSSDLILVFKIDS